MKEVLSKKTQKAIQELSRLNKAQNGATQGIGVAINRTSIHATIPTYAHEGDAGMDLYASEDTLIEPGETVIVPTGIAMTIPKGYELQIRPRSGVTVKTKLRVQLGTIDCIFRGAIGVIVDNTAEDCGGSTPRLRNLVNKTEAYDKTYYPKFTYLIRKGDRIAQGVLAPVSHAQFTEVDALDDSPRGGNGFGSTGVSE